jgi:hypothetical protein
MVNRTSLGCATFTWGKRSRSASVLVRSGSEPRASSANDERMDHNVSLIKLLTHFPTGYGLVRMNTRLGAILENLARIARTAVQCTSDARPILASLG